MNGKLIPTAIVVGVDGSQPSIAALQEAVRLSTRLGTPVHALLCWTIPTSYQLPYSVGTFDFKGAAQGILDTAIEAAFGMDWPENLTTGLKMGPPRQSLIEASKEASLLVLGRRGFGGFTGLLMGSVSSACVSHAHCPVLIVHAPKPGQDHA
ncbi:universal stress protein [Arthrobacter sp. lap29]|uniref:universal stress protein n=1 Tax=Arthrobacter sp. lap29 TaxID=3056122 RepID=UPI0028F73FAB|nr:universal stress protein [Arthrobacter sp. lap29]